MICIENEFLLVTITPLGAELTSVFNKETQLEYMWNGDPLVWPKHSPILFPIVGTLKNNSFVYNSRSYTLNRHGFAREKIFTVHDKQKDEISFNLESSAETLQIYPFPFRLRLKYSLLQNTLSATYEIMNPSNSEIYFSMGAHPAFKVPLVPETTYEDYYLEFEKRETTGRWPISKDGLIEKTAQPFLNDSDRIPLTKELFFRDALVFKSLQSSSVTLKADNTLHGLEFNFNGFPYLGIWAMKGADFVCIEPWCGIADAVDSDQRLENKEGINKLASQDVFVRTWIARFF
jgi:galactose mutarotase-like enzyme